VRELNKTVQDLKLEVETTKKSQRDLGKRLEAIDESHRSPTELKK
jgi:chaperonin cofactor prefoldin